jgi:hypothetical protein
MCAQDARKGVLFDSFPPVLQLQLKRFEYDFQRDIMVKVRCARFYYQSCQQGQLAAVSQLPRRSGSCKRACLALRCPGQ